MSDNEVTNAISLCTIFRIVINEYNILEKLGLEMEALARAKKFS